MARQLKNARNFQRAQQSPQALRARQEAQLRARQRTKRQRIR